jgi:hypothetical protein
LDFRAYFAVSARKRPREFHDLFDHRDDRRFLIPTAPHGEKILTAPERMICSLGRAIGL